MIEQLSEDAAQDLESIIALIDHAVGEPLPARPEGFGVTIREYMAAKSCSDSVARDILDKGVELGVLDKKLMVVHAGSPSYVYFKK